MYVLSELYNKRTHVYGHKYEGNADQIIEGK